MYLFRRIYFLISISVLFLVSGLLATPLLSEEACKEYKENYKPSIHFVILGLDTQLGEFPHMVALGYEKPDEDEVSWGCGGTLISDNYVVTAGHCIFTIDDIPPTIARMGTVNITGPYLGINQNATPQDYRIESITVHPDFNWAKRIHDIALIKLKEKVTMSEFIYPACLYTKNDDPVDLIITGWGNTNTDSPEMSDTLKKADVVPIPVPECNSTIFKRSRKAITENQICAFDNTSDTCYGDSGGPIQSKNTQGSMPYNIVGITSYGLSCAGRYPSVYTRVSMYVDWIEQIVWP